MSTVQFTISVPTDEGFLGRECNSLTCQKYFRVHVDSIKDRMICPYCGTDFSNRELHTQDQVQYIQEAGKEEALQYVHNEFNKMLDQLVKRARGNKFVKFTYKPSKYRPKKVVPRYSEHNVDTELRCPECGFLFQVFGIFGYCPGCSTENMKIYDANISIIKKEIAEALDKRRALRHAYDDLVSTFEHYCTLKAEPINAPKPSFQDLFETRRFFKKYAKVDILEGINDDSNLCIRRIFQKRHAYQHAAGKITERYIKKIPEDTKLLGREAHLSENEFLQGARAIREIIGNLAGGRIR